MRFLLPVVGRERVQCLSATDGPDFFLILVVDLIWRRVIPIASRMRTLAHAEECERPFADEIGFGSGRVLIKRQSEQF